jgi:RimJ/RimL family protein N-acetyltransferase
VRERIATERIVLEPIGEGLARAILAGDLSSLQAGEGWPHADTLDGLRLSPGWLVLLDGTVVGDCGTHGEAQGGEIEIGYGLAEPYRGRGLGGELVRGLSRHLLRQPDVRRVVASTDPANLPSRRALERAGFRLEGEDRTQTRYALRAADLAELRPLAESDSIAELTELLHRAYRALAEQGMRFVASFQEEATTRKRIAGNECWVAVLDGRLVGTVTFVEAAATGGSSWYDRSDVASLHQFGVEPDLQRGGIGTALIEVCERRARETGAAELALDTSEHAAHLIDWYERRGYRQVDRVDWDATNYESVVLSLAL